MLYNIIIMGRDECLDYAEELLENNTIIISVNDRDDNRAKFTENNKIIDILSLVFDDVEYEIENTKLMSVEDSLEIKNYIDIYKERIQDIVIHCTAGISRSAAIGCALSRYLNGDDTNLFKTGQYMPNKHVYRLMCSALNLEYSEKLFKTKMSLSNRNSMKTTKGYSNYGISLEDMFKE